MLETPQSSRALRDELFHWVGFEQDGAAIAAEMDRLRAVETLPDIVDVDNAVVYPISSRYRAVIAGRPAVGVVDADGNIVAAAVLRRQERLQIAHLAEVPDDPVAEEIDQTVIFLGLAFAHFGHFLIETFSRTWAIPGLDPSMPLMYLGASAIGRSWQRDLLRYHGIDVPRILAPTAPVRVRKLIIPGLGFIIRNRVHLPLAEMYAAAAERAAGTPPISDQPLYISRRLVPNLARRVTNELELEEHLRANGFLVVHPETMPIYEQIRLMNQHRVIVGQQGSALHMALYSRIKPHLFITTCPPDLNGNYSLVSELVSAPTTYLNSIRTVSLKGARQPIFQIDVRQVLEHFQEQGLIRSPRTVRPRMEDKATAAELEQQYLLKRVLAATHPDSSANQTVEGSQSGARGWQLAWLAAYGFAKEDRATTTWCVEQFMAGLRSETDLGVISHWSDVIKITRKTVVLACDPDLQPPLKAMLDAFFTQRAQSPWRAAQRAKSAGRPGKRPAGKA